MNGLGPSRIDDALDDIDAQREAITLLTSPEVCARTSATYRQLDYWARRDFISEAPGHAARGSGHKRMWTVDEAAVIGRMVRLVAAGVLPEVAALAAREPDIDYELGPGVHIRVARVAVSDATRALAADAAPDVDGYHADVQAARAELAGVRDAS